MRLRINSLAFRLVAGAAVCLGGGLLVGAYLLSSLYRDYVERSFDDQLTFMLESLIAVSRVEAGGRVTLARALPDPLFDQPYSGWYWQIAGADGPLARSRSLWDKTFAAEDGRDGGALRHYQTHGPDGRAVRALTRTITLPGSDQPYNFTVAGDQAEIGAEVAAFIQTLAVSLGALGLVLVGAVFAQVHYGLRPLRRIAPALADIRSGRDEHLAGEFPAEVAPLARELNELLDHNREVVERARTHVGNLAHALKTPLAVLANEAAAADGPLAETVDRQTRAMRRQVDHHLARARAAARRGTLRVEIKVEPVIEDLSRALVAIHAERGVKIAVKTEPDAVFAGERHDLEEMLGNLMDNACKWAKGTVRVSVAGQDARLVVRVEDDGPGLEPKERVSALKRGRRLDEKVPGSGLGLAIVADLAETYQGGLELESSPMGGLAAVLTLPAGTSRARTSTKGP